MKNLTFRIQGQEHQAGVVKVDRKKLYGWIDNKAVDAEGRTCTLGSLSGDGLHIFGSGCFELLYQDTDGNWLARGATQAMDETGRLLEKQPSSFQQVIELDQTVSIDHYLAHTVRAVYELQAPADLVAHVTTVDGFYRFPFNYTAGYSPDAGFLVANDTGLFLVVGEESGYPFIGPDHVPVPEDIDEDDADLDFGMF